MIKLLKKYMILRTALGLFISLFTISVFQPKESEARSRCCLACCDCMSLISVDLTSAGWTKDWSEINSHIYARLLSHRSGWFDFEFWQRHLLPAFMHMGTQLAAVGSQQVMAIGMFFDAKEQMETQRLLQELHAEASKDYYPSIGVCEFGTRIKSLAASERKGEMNSLILSERSLDRFLGNKSTGAAFGSKSDIVIRLNAFQENYCDTFDNDNSLSFICPSNAPAASPTVAKKDRFNKDIDYQRTIMDPWTIGFDYTDGGMPSEADEEIMAMSNNLYGFNSFERADYEKLINTNRDVSDLQKAYLDMRAVVAKTKVAENSFNALMALKGEGTAGSREFIKAYLEELGIPSTEIDEFLGTNPSYNAQMEVLTKKAYQSPIFYTNLYDKPANIERKGVALQAIGLIQKFDLLKSYLRTEASLSILLELSVDNLQREVEDSILKLGNN